MNKADLFGHRHQCLIGTSDDQRDPKFHASSLLLPVTPKWKLGADVIAVSSQYFFQDDSNLNPQLGGYWRVNLHTSYDVTPRVQIFGIVNNLFDRHYGVFGTFFNLEAGNSAASADPALGDDFFSNPRTITPAAPVAAYAGVKVKFW